MTQIFLTAWDADFKVLSVVSHKFSMYFKSGDITEHKLMIIQNVKRNMLELVNSHFNEQAQSIRKPPQDINDPPPI